MLVSYQCYTDKDRDCYSLGLSRCIRLESQRMDRAYQRRLSDLAEDMYEGCSHTPSRLAQHEVAVDKDDPGR